MQWVTQRSGPSDGRLVGAARCVCSQCMVCSAVWSQPKPYKDIQAVCPASTAQHGHNTTGYQSPPAVWAQPQQDSQYQEVQDRPGFLMIYKDAISVRNCYPERLPLVLSSHTTCCQSISAWAMCRTFSNDAAGCPVCYFVSDGFHILHFRSVRQDAALLLAMISAGDEREGPGPP